MENTRQGLELPAVNMASLATLELVARHLNFARAAEELDVTPTAVSRTIKQLEARLGVRLLNRTTRSVAVTDAGRELLAALAPALAQIRQSVERVSAAARRPSGHLRLNASGAAYGALIEGHLPAFAAQFPDITLEVQIDNDLADIVARSLDAGIRLGHALQRDMISVPLGPRQQMAVVASPAYLAARGTPKTPKELLQHECIRQRLGLSGRLLDWEFASGAKSITIDVQGHLVLNEMRLTLHAARQGCGLAYVFHQLAAPALEEGALVAVLTRHMRPQEAFHLYYPSRAQMPGKLRAFIDFIRAANGATPS